MYAASIVSIYRDPVHGLSPGQTIDVRRPGGDRDRGTHIDRYLAPDAFAFQPGERYILFLRRREWPENLQWSPYRGTYYVETVTGASTFRVDATTIETKGESRVSKETQGMSADMLRSQLRQMGGGL
jgi:hypothetical protein